MKKVLFIGMTPNRGGLETFMINIFSQLEGHGFHFEFINTYNKPIAYTKFIQSHGGVIRHVNINRSHISILCRYYSAKNFFKYHHDYDIVHLNTLSLNNIYWLKAANKFGIPKLIIHSHDCNFVHHSKLVEIISSILAIWNRLFLYNRKIIELAVSKNAGKWMFHNKNFTIIKNGVNVQEYLFNNHSRRILRRKLSICPEAKVFITVARLVPQKNYRKIIGIFNEIHKLNSLTFLVIAGNGVEMDSVKHLVSLLHLTKYVLFLGNINNVNKILSIADLMIMPSIYEGFPFALVESQAAGVPAIVSSEAIPLSSNITGDLEYISLNRSNHFWAKRALRISSTNRIAKKVYMNKLVQSSGYSISFLINQIKNIYNKKNY